MTDWINVCSYTGRRINSLPVDEMNLDMKNRIYCNSLSAMTGCDPRDGALFDTTSMAALVGCNKYHFENIVANEKEFAFVYRNNNFFATYPSSLSTEWVLRKKRIRSEQWDRAGKAAEHCLLTDVSSGSSYS